MTDDSLVTAMQMALFIIEDDLDLREPASGSPRREPRKERRADDAARLYVRPEPNIFSDDTRPVEPSSAPVAPVVAGASPALSSLWGPFSRGVNNALRGSSRCAVGLCASARFVAPDAGRAAQDPARSASGTRCDARRPRLDADGWRVGVAGRRSVHTQRGRVLGARPRSALRAGSDGPPAYAPASISRPWWTNR